MLYYVRRADLLVGGVVGGEVVDLVGEVLGRQSDSFLRVLQRGTMAERLEEGYLYKSLLEESIDRTASDKITTDPRDGSGDTETDDS